MHSKEYRTLSLNAHYIPIFKNPRDMSQDSVLSRQSFPAHPKFLTQEYNQETGRRLVGDWSATGRRLVGKILNILDLSQWSPVPRRRRSPGNQSPSYPIYRPYPLGDRRYNWRYNRRASADCTANCTPDCPADRLVCMALKRGEYGTYYTSSQFGGTQLPAYGGIRRQRRHSLFISLVKAALPMLKQLARSALSIVGSKVLGRVVTTTPRTKLAR